MVTDIGHMVVEQSTEMPFLLVYDFWTPDMYGFGERSYAGAGFRFEVAADLVGEEGSGHTVGKNVLNRIYELLQDNEAAIGTTEDGETLCFRRKTKVPSKVVTKSGGEQYMLTAEEYEVVFS